MGVDQTVHITPTPRIEHWTLFRSGQFVYNFALAEQFIGTEVWRTSPIHFVPSAGKKYINIDRTIITVSLIFEFAARMAYYQILVPAADIEIELHDVDGRELSYMQSGRSLDRPYWCKTENVTIRRTVSTDELSSQARELALDASLDLFAAFGWKPSKDLLREDQDRILGPKA